jgi:Tol biopolymer transport system component
MPQGDEEVRQLSHPVLETGERLESWKEIANFLGRGVRTVQRWEEVEGLPVHRHVHGRGGTVFAYKAEVRQWYEHRESLAGSETEAAPTPPSTSPGTKLPGTKLPWNLLLGAAIVSAILIAIVASRTPARWATATIPSILLNNIGRISQTVLHPDGDRLVYCWNGDREEKNLDLYLWDRRSGASRRLTSNPNNEHSAAWSPAGDRIAFLRDKVGVFVMTAAGSDERLLEAARLGTVYGVGMSWSPDGRWLVYSERESATAPLNLFVLSMSNLTRSQLTRQPPSSRGDTYPSFSPDGLSVAFVRTWPGGKSGLHLLHLSRDGQPAGDPEQIDADAHSLAGLDWLPDGRSLIYSSDRTGLRRLWRIDNSRWRGGWTHPELVAAAGDDAWQPSVARRGQQLVYSRRFWNAAIWRMDLKSASKSSPALSRLIGSTRIERSPAYSPDGARVAFVSDRAGSAEIWTSDRDGHSETQLTHLGRLEPERPTWSPDARWIAFSGRSTGNEGIYVMPSAGGVPTRISSEKLACNSPSWSRDGNWIYCSSAGEQIWKLPATGGDGVAVTAGIRPSTSIDGQWLYFIRRGELWRMPAGGGSQEKLIDATVGDFSLTSRGLYFDLGSGDYTDGVIKFYNPLDRSVSLISQLERRKSGGLTVSPDESTLLMPINERQGSEVLLIKEGR